MHRRKFLLSGGLAAAASAVAQNAPVRAEAVESATPTESPSIVLSQVGFLPKSRKRVIYRLAEGEDAPETFHAAGYRRRAEAFLHHAPSHGGGGRRSQLPCRRFQRHRSGSVLSDHCRRRAVRAILHPERRVAPHAAQGGELPPRAAMRRRGAERAPGLPSRRCPAARYRRAHRRNRRLARCRRPSQMDGRHHDGGFRSVASGAPSRRWLGSGGSGLGVLLDEMRWGNRLFPENAGQGRPRLGRYRGRRERGQQRQSLDRQPRRHRRRSLHQPRQAGHGAGDVRCAAGHGGAGVRRSGCRLCEIVSRGRPPLLGSDRAAETDARPELAGARRTRTPRRHARCPVCRGGGDARPLARGACRLPEFIGSQKTVRGFWSTNETRTTPYVEPVYSALPPIALLELATAFPSHADVSRWRDAVQLYLDEVRLADERPFGLWHHAARHLYRVADRGDVPSAGWRADVPLLHADAAAVVVVGRDVASRIARGPAGTPPRKRLASRSTATWRFDNWNG